MVRNLESKWNKDKNVVMINSQFKSAINNIKVAVYDDMVEITSPGLLPPSIDYSAMYT